MFGPGIPVLAQGRARYVGEPLALVVADSVAHAQDAADAVSLDLAELPSVSDVESACREGAPQLWSEAARNVLLDWEHGDAAAMRKAHQRHALRVHFRMRGPQAQRAVDVGHPLRPGQRGCWPHLWPKERWYPGLLGR